MRNSTLLITQRSGVQIPPPQPQANTTVTLIRRDGYWDIARPVRPLGTTRNTQYPRMSTVEGGHRPGGTLTVQQYGRTFRVWAADLVREAISI